MIRFKGVVGEASRFAVKETETGYECYLDGSKIPSVIKQQLVVGDGIPHVVLEIAVKEYRSDIRRISQE